MLSSHVSELKGVGKLVAAQMAAAGIHTVFDLINYLPRKYNDFSHISSIKQLKPGNVTIEAEIRQVGGRYARRGIHITEALASDKTGSVRLIWFNQPYRAASIKKNSNYYISGNFEFSHTKLSIINPSIELTSEFPLSTARIVPIYPEIKGLKSGLIRKLLRNVMPDIRILSESLPKWLISENNLISRVKMYEMLHFPSDDSTLQEAKRRYGFEEIFHLCLASLINKYDSKSEKTVRINFDDQLALKFVDNLPFKLTDDQRKAVWRIYLAMQKNHPMNLLLEGDVGSGKTVVAAMAALMVAQNGYQAVLMAPTELLARQHAETFHKLFAPLQIPEKITLLVSSIKSREKRMARESIRTGQSKIIVGTHSLIAEKLQIDKLGLVIIDEQHRFGVEQRKRLQAKVGHMPHVLSMSATPIPRSLALTLYGELEIAILSTMPKGRLPVVTEIISANSRQYAFDTAREQIESGRQVFIVCPAISDNNNVMSVESMHKLVTQVFNNRRVGMHHGRQATEDKQKVMEKFLIGDIDILVSTTVVEVGVDVPNATVMIIEGADRFGLAQIHQLRGRVGRGAHQGYCFLITSESSLANPRLNAIKTSNSGFELAEADLKLRGPGAIYGTIQHGILDLKVAKLTDAKLIAAARKGAAEFIDRGENLLQYDHLAEVVLRLRAVTNLN